MDDSIGLGFEFFQDGQVDRIDVGEVPIDRADRHIRLGGNSTCRDGIRLIPLKQSLGRVDDDFDTFLRTLLAGRHPTLQVYWVLNCLIGHTVSHRFYSITLSLKRMEYNRLALAH